MRGRLPGLHLVSDGDLSHRKPKNNPRPKRSLTAPPPPRWLTAIARETWKQLAQGLAEQGLFATQDVDAFAAYCEAKAAYVKALRARARLKSEVMKTPNGGLQQHPLVGMVNKAEAMMFRRGEQFGLTGPMTRKRMNIEDPDAEDGDDGLSKRKG